MDHQTSNFGETSSRSWLKYTLGPGELQLAEVEAMGAAAPLVLAGGTVPLMEAGATLEGEVYQ